VLTLGCRPAAAIRADPNLDLRVSPVVPPRGWCNRAVVKQLVVLVDDHAGFRAQARALCEAHGLRVVGEASDGATALDVVGRLRPDVVLLDIVLPDIDGFAVARRLAGLPQAPQVILISSREASDFGARLTDAPVRGFITKADLSADAIKALLRG
jgi:DNA-binding NarL/FixJ family response regulator